MYVPILPEQPMPATTNVSSGELPVWASAFIIPFMVPKSPQPGHHVGCLSDLKSVNRTFSELMLGLLDLGGEFVGLEVDAVVLVDALDPLEDVVFDDVGELAGRVRFDDDDRLRSLDLVAEVGAGKMYGTEMTRTSTPSASR